MLQKEGKGDSSFLMNVLGILLLGKDFKDYTFCLSEIHLQFMSQGDGILKAY